MVSTLLGVLLSITPQCNLRKVGQKLLYVWVIPAYMMLMSAFCIITAVWSQAEMSFRQATDVNSTSTRSPTQEKIIVWINRGCYGWSFLVTCIVCLILFCCAKKLEKYTGIESVSVMTTKEQEGKKGECAKNELKNANM